MNRKAATILKAVLITGTIFVLGCEKDKDKKTGGSGGRSINPREIVATNVTPVYQPVSANTTVIAFIEGGEAIASAPYQNNGFRLSLPAMLPSQSLYPIGYEEELTISNPSAMIGLMEPIIAYDNVLGLYPGYFFQDCENISADITYLYSDRRLTITGTVDYGYYTYVQWNCSFQAGWNILYFVYNTNHILVTTNRPSGSDFRWYYYSDFYYKANGEKPKKPFEQILNNLYRKTHKRQM